MFFLEQLKTSVPAPPNPYTSGDLAVDFLLRYDGWNSAAAMPVTLRYAIHGEDKRPFLPQAMFLEWLKQANFFPAVTSRAGSESDQVSRQGTFDSWLKWRYFEIWGDIEKALADSLFVYPELLTACGISREILPQLLEDFEDLGTIHQIFPDFETLTHTLRNPQEEPEPLPPQIADLMRAFLHHYTRFVAIDFEEVKDGTHQVHLSSLGYTTVETDLNNCITSAETLPPSLIEGQKEWCVASYSIDNESFLRFGVGDDITFWQSHQKLYVDLAGGGFSSSPLMPSMETLHLTLGDIEAKSFVDLYHLIHHLFLDHPTDSLFFLDYTQERNIDDDVSAMLLATDFSLAESPFSLCSTTLVTGGSPHMIPLRRTEDCIVAGEIRYPITMMPLDLRAIQHLHTPRCETTPIVFHLDGERSPSLFGFPISPHAIFTLFSCHDSTLDLQDYLGHKPVIVDAMAGVGHWNFVGDNWFLWGHGTPVAHVLFPAHAPATFYGAPNQTHHLVLEAFQPTTIILRQPEPGRIQIENYNPAYHAIYVDDGITCGMLPEEHYVTFS